ncbi:endonuclease/exonuclease/phosphatase family protein [Hahella sp. KA22]|uniref:endonuclease/exonuclease/phosphatase family protein n=1 Tax=Hahella sp. KA22 TaxID=1628392 RepID=UPI001F4F080C|nr:endonuclease/exonuclease/phosphatase family protein [Hahella sp. KA22]
MYQKFRDKFGALLPRRSPVMEGDMNAAEEFPHHRHIRLLSFNIQVGISTAAYRHYVTRSWQHVLPSQSRNKNLDRIAALLSQYDVVALQECDGGSIRSGYVNQVEYLAEKSGHPYWFQQLNRNLGRIAQHSNGLLSRYRPNSVTQHKLPGVIPGRGAIIATYGDPSNPLVVVMLHLSLGEKAQCQQLEHVCGLIDGYEHVVLMGDLNNQAEQLLSSTALGRTTLVSLPERVNTFPSWRPERSLDHIMVSPGLQIRNAGVVCFPVSDHLPVAVDVALPVGYGKGKA